MSLLKSLFSQVEQPKAAEVEQSTVSESRLPKPDAETHVSPNHDPEHPNHAYRQALLKQLKERSPDVYAKIMRWD